MIWLLLSIVAAGLWLVAVPLMTTRWYALHRGPTALPRIALTIDDGPDALCGALLDALAKEQISATFFCIGRKLEAAPQLAARITAAGHELGNHTQTHAPLIATLSAAANLAEIAAAQSVIRRFGAPAKWFRAVAGVLSPQALSAARAAGLAPIGWTASARDGGPLQVSVDTALRRLRRGLVPGGILVIHDRASSSAVVLIPELARQARQLGLEFATLSQLLDPSPDKPLSHREVAVTSET